MLSTKLKKIVNAFWAIPVLFFLRPLAPIIRLKIICIRSDRIGHFPIDSVEAICRAERSKGFRIYCLNSRPINKQWYKMLRQKLTFLNFVYYIYFYEKILFKKMSLCEYGTFFKSRDILGNLSKTDIGKLSFNTEDTKEATKWMADQGIGKSDKFICLLVRDETYLKEFTQIAGNFDHHNYRDSDVETYKLGIQYLLDQGYWVIRMGRKTRNKTTINHPKWIDYSQNQSLQSDLMDIWLFSQCTGCISTASGPDIISAIYNRPICFVNFIPISYCWSFIHCLCAPKKLYNNQTGQLLNCSDMITHSYMRTEDYNRNKIGISNLTVQEIKNTFIEFDLMLNGRLNHTKTLNQFETKLKQDLKSHEMSNCLHGYFHPNFKFSSSFLNDQIKLS